MILLMLLITFLLKINFISCQIPAAPLKTGYSQVLAKNLFVLTADSYSKFPGKCIPEFVDYFKYHTFIENYIPICDDHGNKCSYFLLSDITSNTMFIVFSGVKGISQSFYLALSTCNNPVSFFGMGKVNKYFLKAHNILWNQLKKSLQSVVYKKFKFIVTGHSFGGALAALTALRIQLEGIKKSKDIILYTFGEPRIGTLFFANNFDRRIPQSYRIVYGYDFIAHMPRCIKVKGKKVFSRDNIFPCSREHINGYYHHGTEIWYPRGSSSKDLFYECLGAPKNEDFQCSDRLLFKPYKYSRLRAHHSDYFVDMQYKYLFIVNQKYFENCTIYSQY